MTILLTIILIGAIQGFILSVVFFIRKDIVKNKLFALILMAISTALLIAYLQNVIDFVLFPFMIKSSILFPLVFIPLLLIYIQNLTGHTKTKYRYFVPLLILLAYNLPFYFGNSEMKIDYFIRNELENKPLFIDSIEGLFVEFFVLIFSIIAVIESKKYDQNLKRIYSDLLMGKSNWIKILSYTMLTLSLFAFSLSVSALFLENAPIELNFITAIGSTVTIYVISYFLLYSPTTFTDVVLITKSINKDSYIETPKQSFPNDLEQKIIQCIEEEKLYQNPQLTVTELSKKVDLQPYLVSKVINQKLSTTFFSLVNSYRLKQAKKELLNKNEKTIIEIAYEVGFNSKTSFYETFKKDTGVSPSQFIKNNTPE